MKVFKIFNAIKQTRQLKKYVDIFWVYHFTSSEVRRTFDTIRKVIAFPVVLTGLYNFFYRNYIGTEEQAKFPIYLWNVGPTVD